MEPVNPVPDLGHRRPLTPHFLVLPISPLHLTAVSEAELRFGLAIMPPGRRRDGLAEGLERIPRTGFVNRVLPLDSAATTAYTAIVAVRRAMADSQIAAIARARSARGMAVATRNVRDFADAGFDVIDPWAET